MKTTWILRIEGLAMLAAALTVYGMNQTGWVVFALFFLAPDLGMIGYGFGPRVGAWTYNLLHTTVLPLAWGLWILKIGTSSNLWMPAVWLAHIGFDRLMGYGLKRGDGFKDTHLQEH